MLYRLSRQVGRFLFWAGFRVTCEGLSNIPGEGACLMVANHASFLDPFAMGTYVPRHIHYLVYARYYFFPLFHWYCRRVGCIPLKKDGRDISSLKQALRLLRAGHVVGIFPEGERSLNGTLGPGEPGVALIAMKAGAPILPVGIIGTYRAWPRGARFPRFRSRITLRYGRPFLLDQELAHQEKPTEKSEAQAHVTRLIMQKIAAVCEEVPTEALTDPSGKFSE